jgi:spermidine synthase
MIPWVHVGTGPIPGGGSEMRLMQRGEEFSITVDRIELMNNRRRTSEQALGVFGCAAIQHRPNPRVLIGGLGMGFTLGAVLHALGPRAEVVVSELVPVIAEWARGPLAHIFAGSLDDPRVDLRLEDVGRTIQSGAAHFDAILLDVDNGPEGLTKASNDDLYGEWGLKRARFALRPGGVLAVWSGSPDRKFKARLSRCGFSVEERRVHAHGTSGRRHVLWLATRPPGTW